MADHCRGLHGRHVPRGRPFPACLRLALACVGAFAASPSNAAETRRNVNTAEAPYDRRPGEAPRLSDAEIDDLAAFLDTLTDGYDPVSGTADPARSVAPASTQP